MAERSRDLSPIVDAAASLGYPCLKERGGSVSGDEALRPVFVHSVCVCVSPNYRWQVVLLRSAAIYKERIGRKDISCHGSA
jgi:hypothetical protein